MRARRSRRCSDLPASQPAGAVVRKLRYEVRSKSLAASREKNLGRIRDASHQLRRGFQIPVGIGDFTVAEISGQTQHVPGDPVATVRAVFQGANGECVPKSVNRRTRTPRFALQSDPLRRASECRLCISYQQRPSSQRDEYVIVEWSKRASLPEISLQTNLCSAVQWHQTAFSKLGAADDQSVRGDIVKAKPDRLRHAKARACQQGEESAVGLPAKRITPAELEGSLDQASEVFRRKNIRNRARTFLGPEHGWRNLMAMVLCSKETGKSDYLPKATSSRGDRPRNTRPLDRHLGTDIVLAQGARILREALQQSALGMQLETHGATDCQIRLHVLNQHEVTSGHGWAISRSPTTSTFA